MKEIGRALGVAVVVLPIFIFLVSVSVSYAANINAEVRVVPSVGMTCTPDPFVVGDKEKTITCLLEISNYDVSKVRPDTIRLSIAEYSVTPIPILPNSPNSVGDFDKDGIPDMKVTFSKTSANIWFSNLHLPTDFTFVLNGEIQDVPGYVFTSTDRVKVVRPSYTFVHFYGKGGEVTALKGIDLGTAKITGSRLEKSAHQLIKASTFNFVDKWQDILGTVTGEVPVQILPDRYMNFGFTAWVRFESGDCQFTPYTSVVCNGQGFFYKRGLAVGYSREAVDIHAEIGPDKATIIAKQGSVVVFQQLNMQLNVFEYVIKTESPFVIYG